jgi:FecR protein
MKSTRQFASSILVALFTILFFHLAMADEDSDPPSRAIDIRYISGQVSIQPGGVNDWVAAANNRPLTSADRVWTDKESRTELHLGTSAMRLNSETSLTLTNISDQTVQVELDQGTLNLWVRRMYDGEVYEVDTPNLAFTITKSGDYRFDVDPNGDTTRVVVRRGEGEATGQGNGVRLRSDEVAIFSNGTSMQHEISNVSAPDGFDDWCHVRNERAGHSASARYVSPDVIGSEDLDEYGSWRQTPNYGAVWVPAGVGPGWAPYHDGHWVWVEPWGWTWVDDAPWGFAPCHYGRWVYGGGYWGWAPGPVVVVARPVYAPALVAFVGGAHWGVGVSVGGGGGGVGWFPLGWNEPYTPPYAVSRNYFTNVNVTNIHVTNVTVINNYYRNTTVVNNIHYANRNAPGAFAAVPASAMASSQSVRKVALQVPPAEIAKAQVGATAPVAPSRNAVLGGNAGAHVSVPPTQAVSRQVVTKSAPPPRPIPFEAKQDALANNPGHPLDARTVQQIRVRMPQQQNAPNATGAGMPGARDATRPGTLAAPNPNHGPGSNPASPDAERPRNAPAAVPNAGGAPNAGPGRIVPRPPSAGGDRNVSRPNASSPPTTPAPGNGRGGTVGEPGANNPRGSYPRGNNPGANNPGANNPGANNSGVGEPGANNPRGNYPRGNNAGANNPGANNPGATEPGTNNPGANRSVNNNANSSARRPPEQYSPPPPPASSNRGAGETPHGASPRPSDPGPPSNKREEAPKRNEDHKDKDKEH